MADVTYWTGKGEADAKCLTECAVAMRAAVERAEQVTEVLTMENGDRKKALSNAHDYLTLMGHTCVAWMWLRSGVAAARGLQVLPPLEPKVLEAACRSEVCGGAGRHA